MLSRAEMIEGFLKDFVAEKDRTGAEIALTLIAETLEKRAELKGTLTGGLVPRPQPMAGV